jgi:ABC-type thiamine transport system ATPase subunit
MRGRENGAGKTTLLNHLARRCGSSASRPCRSAAAEPYAFSLKVSASVGLGLPESLRLSRAAAHVRVLRTAAFGLQDLADKRLTGFGGESQRLALARVCSYRQVLLLDEPGNH